MPDSEDPWYHVALSGQGERVSCCLANSFPFVYIGGQAESIAEGLFAKWSDDPTLQTSTVVAEQLINFFEAKYASSPRSFVQAHVGGTWRVLYPGLDGGPRSVAIGPQSHADVQRLEVTREALGQAAY